MKNEVQKQLEKKSEKSGEKSHAGVRRCTRVYASGGPGGHYKSINPIHRALMDTLTLHIVPQGTVADRMFEYIRGSGSGVGRMISNNHDNTTTAGTATNAFQH